MCPGDSPNLILTGFMGTGKSAVGREIAHRLDRQFVDMDALIEAREGSSIARIFGQRGEAYFRQVEAALCRELAARSGLVVATGGGALIPGENREILGASGPVVCLTASLDEIVCRLELAQDRPLLEASDRRARIAALLAERAAAYAQFPFQVDTTGLTVAQAADRVLALAAMPQAVAIPVCYPGGTYHIHLGYGLLDRLGELLAEYRWPGQAALVTNPTVAALYADRAVCALHEAGFEVAAHTVPDGEAYKTLDTVRSIYDALVRSGLDRHGVVVALGGGVLGDMAGFAAATYLRGVPLVQVPTTLLAMVDASVGGKVAVDHSQGKNLIGAFKQPDLVVADPALLATLAARDLAGGLAEVIKTALIGDPALFEQIEGHGPAPLRWIVERAVRVKVAVVEEDPFEAGRRAVLNLGHTFGHALEFLSGYTLPHGEAVSIGLAAAARLSVRLGCCDPALVPRLEAVLARLGLPTRIAGFGPDQVWAAMATDKKRQGKALRFVLVRAIGDVTVTDEVAQTDVRAILETMQVP